MIKTMTILKWKLANLGNKFSFPNTKAIFTSTSSCIFFIRVWAWIKNLAIHYLIEMSQTDKICNFQASLKKTAELMCLLNGLVVC